MAPWRSHPILTALGALVGAVIVAILVVFAAWDWNWFRPLLEKTASTALGRPVTIANLNADIWHLTLEADGIAVANPPGFPNGSPFATIDKIFVTIDPRSLLGNRLHIPALVVDRPKATLRRDAAGKPNWTFGAAPSKPPPSQPVKKTKEKVTPPPLLGSVIINDGHIDVNDPKTKTVFAVDIHTERPPRGAEPQLVLAANGKYVGQDFKVRFHGGSLLSLRDPDKPYPIDLTAEHGQTHVTIKGTLQNPSAFAGADIQLKLEGRDMSELASLTSIPLASTPPYHLSGHLNFGNGRIRFDDFSGAVGNSDLSGWFAVNPGQYRPKITAEMESKSVDLADLAGFIGAPTHKNETSPTLFPDTPINLTAVRSNDYDIRYTADSIKNKSVPIDHLKTHLLIQNGVVKLDPLNFGIGNGTLASKFTLDATQTPPKASLKLDVRQVDLRRLTSAAIVHGQGIIGGNALLDGSGISLADMLGTSNGEIRLFMSGGDINALIVGLAGLDFGNSLLAALGIPQRTNLRCMVSDFYVQNGVMDTRLFLIDTAEANILPKGSINLKDQTFDFTITTDPKRPSIGFLGTPIHIGGPLKSPAIMPNVASLGARAGAAAALSALLTPLAGLIPTIQLGLGENHDCDALIEAAEKQALSPMGNPEKAPEKNKGESATGQPQGPAGVLKKAPEENKGGSATGQARDPAGVPTKPPKGNQGGSATGQSRDPAGVPTKTPENQGGSAAPKP